MPSRTPALERREQSARHELSVVMEEATGCREQHEIALSQLRRWLRHLNRAGQELLSDLEYEIDHSLPESDWLWTAIEGILNASREIMSIRRRVLADGDLGEVSGNLYVDIDTDQNLKTVQEMVSDIQTLIPRGSGDMPEAYGEG